MAEPAPATVIDLPPVAGAPPARRRARHWGAILGLVLLVALPTGLAAWYLYALAAERYASRAAFSIRSHDAAAPLEIFGAVTQLGTSSSAQDGQVLYDFIDSQQIIEEISREVDLETIWNRAPQDVLFALGHDQPIEELVEHWRRMVDITLDPTRGILMLEVRAFRPDDAHLIAAAVLEASGRLVNALSEDARADAVRYAAEDLAGAEERLRAIRTRLRAFRHLEQEVDPTANARAALELVASLHEERTRAQVRLDQIADQLAPGAPQIRTLQRRIATLDGQIAEERTRLGRGSARSEAAERRLSDIVGDFEELQVDREFAQQAYTLALAGYEQALAEARRRHRYLAVHIRPTRSEEAEYPDRPLWLATVFLVALALWAIAVLIVGNLRERR